MKPQRYGPFPYTPITQRPKITWPGGARAAFWIIPNVEFFPLDETVPVRGPSGKVPIFPTGRNGITVPALVSSASWTC